MVTWGDLTGTTLLLPKQVVGFAVWYQMLLWIPDGYILRCVRGSRITLVTTHLVSAGKSMAVASVVVHVVRADIANESRGPHHAPSPPPCLGHLVLLLEAGGMTLVLNTD